MAESARDGEHEADWLLVRDALDSSFRVLGFVIAAIRLRKLAAAMTMPVLKTMWGAAFRHGREEAGGLVGPLRKLLKEDSF